MKKFFLPVFIWLILPGKSTAQAGCTDPQALNFNPSATLNDGSCTYPATSYSLMTIAQLPPALEECSGLAFFSNRLWTQEDGGGQDQLYILDTLSGSLVQTITLPGTDNEDWEDLAEDSEHLYIGDFGNNQGNRTDLKILKFKKADLLAGNATHEVISFSFSDQTDFSTAPNANNYDCEAFFFWNGALHLFSKNWLDFKTRHYVLSAVAGTHVAQLQGSFTVQGQITGADISPDGKAVLLGYNVSTSETFLWLLFDFTGNDIFGGNKRKISTGSAIFVSQPEGIVFRNDHYGYICSERFSSLPQKLLSFDISQWTTNPTATAEKLPDDFVLVSPNPARDFVMLDFKGNTGKILDIELRDVHGTIWRKWTCRLDSATDSLRLEIGDLPGGIFYISIRMENGVVTKQLLRV